MSAEFLIRKLHAFSALRPNDEKALRALAKKPKHTRRNEDVISEGDDPKVVNLISKGWGYRYKFLEDGRRQILGFFLPGDLCDLNVYILRQMDHSIGAVTALEHYPIRPSVMDQLADENPRVMHALWWDTLVTSSIQREWTVSVGQRDAFESLAHLLCELYLRLRVIGLAEDRRCTVPLTQAHIADALGLTPTHTGRVLRKLNESGVARFEKKLLTINDFRALQEIGAFNANYLHYNFD
jgi:CRP-like cAMP-binding protein